MKKHIILLPLLTMSFSIPNAMNDILPEQFELNIPIETYPDFLKLPYAPDGTLEGSLAVQNLLRIKRFEYYQYKDSDTYLFLGERVRYILATTFPADSLLFSVSIVCDYTPDLLEKLNVHYGHWRTAGGNQMDGVSDSSIRKASFFFWKNEAHTLELIVNRNAGFGGIGGVKDYMIFSYKPKNYQDLIHNRNK